MYPDLKCTLTQSISQPRVYHNPKNTSCQIIPLPKVYPDSNYTLTQNIPQPKLYYRLKSTQPNEYSNRKYSGCRNKNRSPIVAAETTFISAATGCRFTFVSAASGCRFSYRLQNPYRLQKNRLPKTNSLYKSLMKNDHRLQVIAVYGFKAPNINLHYHQF